MPSVLRGTGQESTTSGPPERETVRISVHGIGEANDYDYDYD